LANDHNDMADTCLHAAEQVMTHGSPALQAAMRRMLLILGQEIARERKSPAPDEAKPREPFRAGKRPVTRARRTLRRNLRRSGVLV